MRNVDSHERQNHGAFVCLGSNERLQVTAPALHHRGLPPLNLRDTDLSLVSGSSQVGVISVGLLDIHLLGASLHNAKQVIHLLQADALGFGNEEPYKDEHGETETSVDVVCTSHNVSTKYAICQETGTYPKPPSPTVAIMFGVARATTKLKSH